MVVFQIELSTLSGTNNIGYINMPPVSAVPIQLDKSFSSYSLFLRYVGFGEFANSYN
jgi:hypothetical protein